MNRRNPARLRLAGPLLAVALGVALAACARTEEVRGYVPDEDLLAEVQPGKQSRDQVAEILGSPSTVATFEAKSDTWYYITTRSEHFAFFDDKIVDQQVVAIDFDESGRVKQVRRFDMDDGREIDPVDRETPTRGREFGLFEQLFGNIGRFTNR